MISEREFSSVYTSLWRDIAPSMDRYVRTVNLTVDRFAKPYIGRSPASLNGVVNETAFRAVLKGSRRDSLVNSYDGLHELVAEVGRWLSIPIKRNLETLVIDDALNLAKRLNAFLRRTCTTRQNFEFEPKFRGCGVISECVGDLLYGRSLFEVKAGDRTFRSPDLRQALVYIALDYAAGLDRISDIVLVNPRWGVSWKAGLDAIAAGCGSSRSVLLADVANGARLPLLSS